MPGFVTEYFGIVSGASKEDLFSSLYHGKEIPIKVSGKPASAVVTRLQTGTSSGTFGVIFRATWSGKTKPIDVPNYEVGESKGGEGSRSYRESERAL